MISTLNLGVFMRVNERSSHVIHERTMELDLFKKSFDLIHETTLVLEFNLLILKIV